MKKSPIFKKKKKMHNPIWNLQELENTGKTGKIWKTAKNHKFFTVYRKKTILFINLYLKQIIQDKIGIVKNRQTV